MFRRTSRPFSGDLMKNRKVVFSYNSNGIDEKQLEIWYKGNVKN